jgi:RNA polymerase sigma-70 factor, ECF subfamily
MTQNTPSTPFEIPHDDRTDYATWLIHLEAKALVGHFDITEDDVEDIEQDIALHLIEGWPQYDPNRGTPQMFVSQVVKNKITNIVRHLQTDSCRYERMARLPYSPEKAEEMADQLPGHPVRTNDMTGFELQMDLETVLAELPQEMREVCERLKTESVRAIASDLGIPVSTLRCQLTQLRERFEAAGFRDYL